MRISTLLSFLFFSVYSTSQAYPLFFSCKADKSISNVLTPRELSTQLNRLAAASGGTQQSVHQACTDYQSCLNDLVNLMQLSQAAGQMTRDQIVQRIEAHAARTKQSVAALGITKISDRDMSALAQINRANAKTYSCKAAADELDPNLLKNGNNCTAANFQHSPYMYVSGQRFSGAPGGESRPIGPLQCSSLDSVIDSAVAMGQDPYGALAISLMENSTGVDGLYLDPIGMVKTLGCPVQSVRAATAHQFNATKTQCETGCRTQYSHTATFQGTTLPPKTSIPTENLEAYRNCRQRCAQQPPFNLNSYSTYYNVNYATPVTNQGLERRIRTFAESRLASSGMGFNNQPGFLCSNSTEVAFSATQVQNSCCLRTSFMPADDGSSGYGAANAAKRALTFASLDQYLEAPLLASQQNRGGGESAARRIQRFNGFSPLMGGAEGVPAWRSGVNYNSTPAYGYQALDFMFNSLMSNPMISEKVKAAEQKYGHKSPSVVCADLAAGSYYMPSDFYFNKHRDAPRMGTIQDAWTAGQRNFTSLTQAQQNVLTREFRELCDGARSRTVMQERLPDYASFLANCGSPAQQYSYYMTKILPLRRTIGQASFIDQGYDWRPMNETQVSQLVERTRASSAGYNQQQSYYAQVQAQMQQQQQLNGTTGAPTPVPGGMTGGFGTFGGGIGFGSNGVYGYPATQPNPTGSVVPVDPVPPGGGFPAPSGYSGNTSASCPDCATNANGTDSEDDEDMEEGSSN